MIKNNVKKISICLVIVFIITLLGARTFATQNLLDALAKPNNEGEKIDGTDADPIKEGTPAKTDSEPLDEKTEEKTEEKTPETKTQTPTETPNLGVGDYSTYIFIGLFAISAVYGFKKIREYK